MPRHCRDAVWLRWANRRWRRSSETPRGSIPTRSPSKTPSAHSRTGSWSVDRIGSLDTSWTWASAPRHRSHWPSPDRSTPCSQSGRSPKPVAFSSRSIPVIPQIELRTCSRIRVCGSEFGPPRLRPVRQPVGTSQSGSTSATRTRLQNVPPTPTLPSTTLTEQRRSLRRRLRTSSTPPARPECRRAPSSLTRVWPILLANNRIGTGSPPGRELCILRHRASTAPYSSYCSPVRPARRW